LLHWLDKTGMIRWSTGSARLFLDEERPTGRLPVAVRCRFGSLRTQEIAMLDTGAEFTLMNSALLELLGEEVGEPLEDVVMSTRLGRFRGTKHYLPLHLIADRGTDLTVNATCIALPDWGGPTILGFKGFLDRLRFAIDPGSRDVPASIHFGQWAPHPP
jgi:hypothetical protein